MARKKYSPEEQAVAREQEQGDQLVETVAMLQNRCVGLRMELNRANARIAELEQATE